MNLDVINAKYNFLFNIPKNYIPAICHSEKLSRTIVLGDQETNFTLNPVNDGAFIEPEIGSLQQEGKGLIFRVNIGYRCLCMAELDFTYGCLVFSSIINGLLIEAAKYLPSHLASFKTITFNRPGNGTILRDLEDSVGAELRLFIEY